MRGKELFYYVTSGSNVMRNVHWCLTVVDYQQIVNSNIANQIHGLGNSRKYPYPTTDGFHVLTPPCHQKFSRMCYPPMPSGFHNREPPLSFGISRVFLEVHFRLGNVYMNKQTWIYASPRLWSSGARQQALLFSDKKNLPTACGQAVQPFF